MAITAVEKPVAASQRSATQKRWDITATLDADGLLQLAHGMGAFPGFDPEKLLVWVQARIGPGRISNWTALVNSTTVFCEKSTAVGSGDPNVQAYLYIQIPHSIL